MNDSEQARNIGRSSAAPKKIPSKMDKPVRPYDQPGLALKFVSPKWQVELIAKGTVVVLSLVGILGWAAFSWLQYNPPSSNSAQAAQLNK